MGKILDKRSFINMLAFVIFMIFEVSVYILQKDVSISADTKGIYFYISMLCQPLLWLSLMIGIGQFFLWTYLLRRVQLSKVYCMSSLSYPLTMLCATIIFKEHLSTLVWTGGVLISIGVYIIGRK